MKKREVIPVTEYAKLCKSSVSTIYYRLKIGTIRFALGHPGYIDPLEYPPANPKRNKKGTYKAKIID